MSWTPSSATPGNSMGDQLQPSSSSSTFTGYGMEYGSGSYYPSSSHQGALSSSIPQRAGAVGTLLEDDSGKGKGRTISPLPRATGSTSAALNANDVLLDDESRVSNGDHDDLLVFGYECKIFRDDERAKWIDEQKHLIPWMGSSDLLIDRYDCRGALMDISKFEPSSPAIREQLEVDTNVNSMYNNEIMEKELNEERYKDLNEDEEYDEGSFGQDLKRLQLDVNGMTTDKAEPGGQYASFAYNYDESNNDVSIGPEPKPHDEDAPYVKPDGLYIPEEIALPITTKVHAIIEKTAKFIAGQGNQMEIILKTKQASNPLFDFLNHGGTLNPYYKFLVHAIRNGIYRPTEPTEENLSGSSQSLSECGGSEEDSEHTYLHPSLFRSAPTTSFASVISSYPAGAVSSRHSSYSMLVSKIKGTDSPDPLSQPPSTIPSAVPDQSSTFGVYSSTKTAHPTSGVSTSLERPPKQLPSTQDQLIIEKMASYVIKNGTSFEVLAKNKGDPRFAFLNSSHQYHWYYLNCKERFKAECNAVVASGDFVTYGSTGSRSTVDSLPLATSKSNAAASSGSKKSSVTSERTDAKRKVSGLLQGKKLVPKDKPISTGGTAPISSTSTEDVFSQANLVNNKDKDKPVIRFATSLSLNTTSGSGKECSKTNVMAAMLSHEYSKSDGINPETSSKDEYRRITATSIEKSDEIGVETVAENDREVGELDHGELSFADMSPFSGHTGDNMSPVSENEDEKIRRRTERKRKAAIFLQKLKLAKADEDAEKSVEQSAQPPPNSGFSATGSSLGDLLSRRLLESEISKSRTLPVHAVDSYNDDKTFEENVNDGGKSSSSLSSRQSTRSRSRSYVGTSSSRSRKRRKRSRSYSSTPSYSSSNSSYDSSDYESSSRAKKKSSSRRKHRKKKRKHEKSRSSRKSSRR